jgi:hypothetical protein
MLDKVMSILGDVARDGGCGLVRELHAKLVIEAKASDEQPPPF